MFYHVNPKYKYQFFSPQIGKEDPEVHDNEPTDNKPLKRNLINALAALYRAYGGEEELKNNAVDIIYKIADAINEKNNTPDDIIPASEAGSGGPPSEAGSGGPPNEGQKK